MAKQDGELSNIREYVKESKEARGLQDGTMDFDASNTEARLDQTVRSLQSRVQEQQAALEKVWTVSSSRSLH
jgi:hypothetical protein